MKQEYEEPIVTVIEIDDRAIMESSDEHDNSYGDFGDWNEDNL